MNPNVNVTQVKHYVVDADGRRIYPPAPRPLSKPKLTRNNDTVVANKLKDLDRLEDAIFEHGSPYRQMFLNLYKDIESEETLDEHLAKHVGRRHKTLVYCRDKLKWRPTAAGDRVKVLNPDNPYTK